MISFILSAAIAVGTQFDSVKNLAPLPPKIGIPKPVGPRYEPIPIEEPIPEPCEPKPIKITTPSTRKQ